jgi:hypothetical protein
MVETIAGFIAGVSLVVWAVCIYLKLNDLNENMRMIANEFVRFSHTHSLLLQEYRENATLGVHDRKCKNGDER